MGNHHSDQCNICLVFLKYDFQVLFFTTLFINIASYCLRSTVEATDAVLTSLVSKMEADNSAQTTVNVSSVDKGNVVKNLRRVKFTSELRG